MANSKKEPSKAPKKSLADRWREDEQYGVNPIITPPPKPPKKKN